MQPPCRVIVLESNPLSCRAYKTLARSLKRQAWSWSVFPAVEGSRVTDQHWQEIGVDILTDRGKLQHRPGAQGCWLSHFQLWRECRDSGGSMIILEEDALAVAAWDPEILQQDKLVKLYENLNGEGSTKTNSITGVWSQGSIAYWLTAAQADRLITHSQRYGAQALDKHLGDSVVSWQHWPRPLFELNRRRGPSTTSPIRR
jgi:hypothetical protein